MPTCFKLHRRVDNLDGNAYCYGDLKPKAEERPSQAPVVRTYSLNMSRRLVGYISVVLLIIATLSNSNLDLVHAHHDVSTSKLGPAALSSLTSVLSPILPFAGGADLRKGETILDLLPTGTFDTFTDSLNRWRVLDGKSGGKPKKKFIEDVPRGGSLVLDAVQKKERVALRKKLEAEPSIMAGVDPFVSTEVIAQLTLEELGDIFYFTVMHNSKEFDREILSSMSPAVKKIVNTIEEVTGQIRGSGVLPSSTSATLDGEGGLTSEWCGDVDALSFLALMRVFAEWRVLRQVPDGYRGEVAITYHFACLTTPLGYAVGMNLGHKDVVQNLAKVELAVHLWIIERRDFVANENERIALLKNEREECEGDNCEEENPDFLVLRSPTLRDLLQYEIDTDLHDGKLPALKEKSAGMGLLWVRRQLQYQLAIYSNIDSGKYSTTNEAVAEAYKEVYEHYHSWAVQKIFNYSFQAAPDSKEIFKTMNPRYLQKLLVEARTASYSFEVEDMSQNTEQDTITDSDDVNNTNESQNDNAKTETHNENSFVQLCNHIGSEWNKLGKHIQTESDKLGKHIQKEWDNLGKHVNNEWTKISSNVANIFKNEKNSFEHVNTPDCDIRGGAEELQGEALEQFVLDQLTIETHRQISVFLKVSKPILEDLSRLFDEMNMNDPKKV